MDILAIITGLIASGAKAAPAIVHFIQMLKGGEPPTQAEVDDAWARHKSAYSEIMAEDPNTHKE